MTAIMPTLGGNLQRLRKLRGLSQDKLAEMVDVSREHISRVENAETWVSVEMVKAFAGALGFEETEFFRDPANAVRRATPREALEVLAEALELPAPASRRAPRAARAPAPVSAILGKIAWTDARERAAAEVLAALSTLDEHELRALVSTAQAFAAGHEPQKKGEHGNS
jgi:transcriptional regulator with XRE-family HTH domain